MASSLRSLQFLIIFWFEMSIRAIAMKKGIGWLVIILKNP